MNEVEIVEKITTIILNGNKEKLTKALKQNKVGVLSWISRSITTWLTLLVIEAQTEVVISHNLKQLSESILHELETKCC